MFVPDYVLYHIKLNLGSNNNNLNNNIIEVKRRLKDFDTLKNLLRKLYPANRLPHL
jgi:hypothetical protein